MKLLLLDGYPYPYPQHLSPAEKEAIDAEAPSCRLELPGVASVEWLHDLTVEFGTHRDYTAARNRTGWEAYDEHDCLEARTSYDEGYDHPAVVVGSTAYCGMLLAAE